MYKTTDTKNKSEIKNLICALLGFSAVVLSLNTNASTIFDNLNSVTYTGGPVIYWNAFHPNAGSPGQRVAMRFQSSSDPELLTSITIPLDTRVDPGKSTNPNLRISICKDNNGVPDFAPLEVLADNPPLPQTTNGPELFTFFSKTNPLLNANSKYWIVLEPVIFNLSDSSNDANYVWQGAPLDTGYTIGAYYDTGTNSWEQWNIGLPFIVEPGLRVVGSEVDSIPPTINANANPSILWPPNGKKMAVTISGAMTDNDSGINLSTAMFVVRDEYGIVQPHGPITIEENGEYSFVVQLEASRRGNDLNGRAYMIFVSAQDNAQNTGSVQINVTVPHDLRK